MRKLKLNVYPVLAAVLLGAIAGHRYVTMRKPPGTPEYHQRIREAAVALPGQIGAWVGQDVHVPVQAKTVLRPNVMLSRKYLNVETGQSVGLMLVHCADAHHMVGHFPLRCYTAAGWNVQDQRLRQWSVGALEMPSTEYVFHKDAPLLSGGSQSLVVVNSLLRPGGRILHDMTGLTQSLIGANDSATGAGQLQIYFDAQTPPEQRDAAVAALIEGILPVVTAILDDPAK